MKKQISLSQEINQTPDAKPLKKSAPAKAAKISPAPKAIKKSQDNQMKKIKLEKVVLSCGAVGPDLEKSKKLLQLLTKKKAQIIKAGPQRRIPAFGVKPGLELGVRITLRKKEAMSLLRQLLGAVDNELAKKQVAQNSFSFGIREYIEIPDVEYQRDLGIRGLNVTVVFIRPGVRVKRKKIKAGKTPARHHVSPQEIIKFMEDNFTTKFR